MESLDSKGFLRSLGLSEYEARAYVSLVMEGPCEAGKLSVKCGVPRQKIYAALNKLKKRGLVLELPRSPRRFVPISPNEAFDEYLLHLREEVSNRLISLMKSREIVSSLEEDYDETQSNLEHKRETVWVIQGMSEIVDKMEEALSQAQRSVTLITTAEDFIFLYKTFGKLLDDLVENDVNVRMGTEINSRNEHIARELNYICEVKNVGTCAPLLYLRVDEQSCLLAKLNPDNLNIKSEKGLGVFCNGSNLCNLISSMFPGLD